MTRKETERARGAHWLETAKRGICQDTKGESPRESHSLSEDGRERELSGQGKDLKVARQGALTNWRQHREGRFRTRKETGRERGVLTNWRRQREGGLSRQGKKAIEQGALTSCRQRGMDLSRHRKRPNEGHSLPENHRGRNLSRHRKKATKGRAPTLWRQRTCLDTERNQQSKGNSRTGKGRRRNSSEHGKKPTERGALTLWRRQRERCVRTWKRK